MKHEVVGIGLTGHQNSLHLLNGLREIPIPGELLGLSPCSDALVQRCIPSGVIDCRRRNGPAAPDSLSTLGEGFSNLFQTRVFPDQWALT